MTQLVPSGTQPDGQLLGATLHLDGPALVPERTTNDAQDGRGGERAERRTVGRIEPVDGSDEGFDRDLLEIVAPDATAPVLVGDLVRQTEVPLDQGGPELGATGAGELDESGRLVEP